MHRDGNTIRALNGLAALLLVWALFAPSVHADHVDHPEEVGGAHECAYCHPAQSGSLLEIRSLDVVAPVVAVEIVATVDEAAPRTEALETARPRGPPVPA